MDQQAERAEVGRDKNTKNSKEMIRMPMFVILGNWTTKRMETIKDLPDGIKRGPKVFESFGVKIHSLLFTMGRYDLIAVGEAPDAESMSKALLKWGQEGLLRTETLRGYTPEKMIDLIQGI
jgi:uncharacterized protein with GYD domain